MKVNIDRVEQPEGDFLAVFVEHDGCSACQEVDDMMTSEYFDIEGEMSYEGIWSDLCMDIFGSWFIRAKNITTGNWCIFYPLSKIKLIAKMQMNHIYFTASISSLEMERLEKLIEDKYGLQLSMHLGY